MNLYVLLFIIGGCVTLDYLWIKIALSIIRVSFGNPRVTYHEYRGTQK